MNDGNPPGGSPFRLEEDSNVNDPGNDEQSGDRRFHGGNSTGDWELMSKTIDEVFQPDELIRTPLPVQAPGVQAIKEVFATLLHAIPTSTSGTLTRSPSGLVHHRHLLCVCPPWSAS